MLRRSIWLAVVAGVLIALRGAPAQLVHDAGAPGTWADRVGADGIAAQLAATALWALAAWTGVALVAAAAAELPGVPGRCARWLSRRIVPAVLLRVVAGTAGLSVIVAPAAVSAAASPASSVAAAVVHPSLRPAESTPPTVGGSAAWPTGPSPTPVAPSPDAPRWPVSPTEPPQRTPARPAPPAPPATAVPTAIAAPPASAVADGRSEHPRVTVRRGDSLWLIAARRLGPHADARHVAAAWPTWYAANRDLIGPDPNLIRPGQVLRAPADHPGGTP